MTDIDVRGSMIRLKFNQEVHKKPVEVQLQNIIMYILQIPVP